jgi:hypothetical protein
MSAGAPQACGIPASISPPGLHTTDVVLLSLDSDSSLAGKAGPVGNVMRSSSPGRWSRVARVGP